MAHARERRFQFFMCESDGRLRRDISVGGWERDGRLVVGAGGGIDGSDVRARLAITRRVGFRVGGGRYRHGRRVVRRRRLQETVSTTNRC